MNKILNLLKLSAIEISNKLKFCDSKTLSDFSNLENKSGEKIKYLDKSEYVLRPDFINTLRLFN